MSLKDRFDLENEIMKLYSFADDIELVVKYIAEDVDCDPKIADTASNALNGIQTLLCLHAENMLDTMRQIFELDQYNKNLNSFLTDTDTSGINKCCAKKCKNKPEGY